MTHKNSKVFKIFSLWLEERGLYRSTEQKVCESKKQKKKKLQLYINFRDVDLS